jgi:hypothetical protein
MSLPSGRPEIIAPAEKLARFFNHSTSSRKKAYSEIKGVKIPKQSIFIPDRHTDLSVSRISGLGEVELTETGDKVLELIEIGAAHSQTRAEQESRKKTHGAIILTCEDIRNESMQVISDELPLHHALILGWAGCEGKHKLPSYDGMKSQRKKQAQELANKAEVSIIREIDDPVFAA